MRSVLVLLVGLGVALGNVASAQSYTESVLYNFPVPPVNGMWPWAGLTIDAAGNLYGATYAGGIRAGKCGGGCGVLFKLDPQGNLTVLHEFRVNDGENVQVNPTLDAAGNLYGVASTGLKASQDGTVFKVAADGTFTIVHRFHGMDGSYPYSPILIDSAGNLYGTTNLGGAYGYGVVYTISTAGTESVLYNFTGGADGGAPNGNLLRDGAGNLYGTATLGGAAAGGSGFGTIFKLTPSGTESVLYTFCGTPGCTDGKYPDSIVRTASGDFFGTTTEGGTGGQGTVFGINPAGEEIMLYSFCSAGTSSNCGDGSTPTGPLFALDGNLYGTTESGGLGTDYFVDPGVIYEMSQSGAETLLYSFPFPNTYALGGNPESGVVSDGAGNLYGTFYSGGPMGGGGIFKLTKN
jgi:uncharacterized repeat protein (TIGR03803 family)